METAKEYILEHIDDETIFMPKELIDKLTLEDVIFLNIEPKYELSEEYYQLFGYVGLYGEFDMNITNKTANIDNIILLVAPKAKYDSGCAIKVKLNGEKYNFDYHLLEAWNLVKKYKIKNSYIATMILDLSCSPINIEMSMDEKINLYAGRVPTKSAAKV